MVAKVQNKIAFLVCNVMRSTVKDATESAFQQKSKELVDTCQKTLRSYADVAKSCLTLELVIKTAQLGSSNGTDSASIFMQSIKTA